MSAAELVEVCKRRGEPLPAALGAFVAFEACDALLSRGAHLVSLDSILISDDGVITLGATSPTIEAAAARSVCAALAALLVATGPSVPDATLLRLAELGPDGKWTRARLREELQVALGGAERTALRRALAQRISRVRERDTAVAAPAPHVLMAIVDRELGALLRGEATYTSLEPVTDGSAPSSRADERQSSARALQTCSQDSERQRRVSSAPPARAAASDAVDFGLAWPLVLVALGVIALGAWLNAEAPSPPVPSPQTVIAHTN